VRGPTLCRGDGADGFSHPLYQRANPRIGSGRRGADRYLGQGEEHRVCLPFHLPLDVSLTRWPFQNPRRRMLLHPFGRHNDGPSPPQRDRELLCPALPRLWSGPGSTTGGSVRTPARSSVGGCGAGIDDVCEQRDDSGVYGREHEPGEVLVAEPGGEGFVGYVAQAQSQLRDTDLDAGQWIWWTGPGIAAILLAVLYNVVPPNHAAPKEKESGQPGSA